MRFREWRRIYNKIRAHLREFPKPCAIADRLDAEELVLLRRAMEVVKDVVWSVRDGLEDFTPTFYGFSLILSYPTRIDYCAKDRAFRVYIHRPAITLDKVVRELLRYARARLGRAKIVIEVEPRAGANIEGLEPVDSTKLQELRELGLRQCLPREGSLAKIVCV